MTHSHEKLTAAAAIGDTAAWAALVEEYAVVVWRAARDADLPADVARVVCRLAWLRVAEVLERHPDLGAEVRDVLVQTVEREARAHVASQARQSASQTRAGPPLSARRINGSRGALRLHDEPGRQAEVGGMADTVGQVDEHDEEPESADDSGTPGRRRGERRRYNRRPPGPEVTPPYYEAFERIASALEGIEAALTSRQIELPADTPPPPRRKKAPMR